MGIFKEKRMNREVELKSVKRPGSEYRYVVYSLKTDNPIKKFFAKKGMLFRAFYCSPVLTNLFDSKEFKEVVKELKTYADVKKWQEKQRELDKAHRDYEEKEWAIDDE